MAGTNLSAYQMQFISSGAGGLTKEAIMGPGTNYLIEKVEGLFDLPDVRISDMAKANGHGLWRGHDLAGGKTITMTVGIKRTSATLMRDTLEALLQALAFGRGNYYLNYEVPGAAQGQAWGDQRQVQVMPRKLRVNGTLYGTGYVSVDIELMAHDPRSYSYDPNQAGPQCFTRSLNMKVAGAVTVPNIGNAGAGFRLVITGACSAWTLRDVNRPAMIAFTTPVTNGLVVDTISRTITGSVATPYKWITRWDLLEIPAIYGTRFAFLGSGAGTVTLQYSDAWW
jgi:hypothetical protein